MEEIVKRIGSAPGIVEVFLSNREGKLLATSLGQKREEEKVAKASSILARSVYGLEGIGERVEEMELSFKKERVLIKNLDGGILCIFCNPKINPALLRLSTGLQIMDLKNKLEKGDAQISSKDGDEEWWMVLEEGLKRAVGPMAHYILEEKKRGLGGSLGATEKVELVEKLSQEIPAEGKREGFKREILKGFG